MSTEFGINNLKDEAGEIPQKISALSNEFLSFSKDLSRVLSENKKITILSGRCPSKYMNLIHLKLYKTIFEVQKLVDARVIIPIAIEEVFLRKEEDLSTIKRRSNYNIKIIKKLNPDLSKTQFIINTRRMNSEIFNLSLDISKSITNKELKNIFGEEYFSNPGLMFIPSLQCAEIINPIIKGGNVILISGPEQDTYLRISRKYSEKRNISKPAAIFSRRIIDLRGGLRKESDPEGALYYEDTKREIERKIGKAFTGGKESRERQQIEGGNPDICPIFEYIKIFEKNLEFSRELEKKCKKGTIICSHCKERLNFLINEFKEGIK